MSVTSPDTTKLSFREKAGYSLGDASANFVFQMFIVFPAAFYIDVMGISAAAMGTMLLLVRCVDAVTDPMMGAIADRTTHRWGRFRPWLLWSAIPFALLFWAAFTVPSGLAESGRLWYAVVTYTLLMIAYTMNNVPYASLTGVMTADGVERTSISTYRFAAAMGAAFLVKGLTLPLVNKFGDGDPARGWSITVGIFAGVSVVFFIISFLSVKERVQPPKDQIPDLRRDLKDVARNKPWLAMFGMTLFVFTTLALRGNASYLHIHYYMDPEALRGFIQWSGLFASAAVIENSGWGYKLLDGLGLILKPSENPTAIGFSAFSITGTLVSLLGVIAARPLASRFGKKLVFTIGLSGAALFQGLTFFLQPSEVPLMFLLTIFTSICYGPTIPLLWAMIGDAADWGEWKNHRRSTGFVFAGVVFALKAGLGIGGALAGWLLSVYGFSPASAHLAEVQFGLRMLVGIWSGAFFGVGVIFMFFYPISKNLERVISGQLLERRRTALAESDPPL